MNSTTNPTDSTEKASNSTANGMNTTAKVPNSTAHWIKPTAKVINSIAKTWNFSLCLHNMIGYGQ